MAITKKSLISGSSSTQSTSKKAVNSKAVTARVSAAKAVTAIKFARAAAPMIGKKYMN